MQPAGTRRTPLRVRRPLIALAAACLAALIGFAPFAGRYLVVEQPLDRADAIVVLAGARVERWLEAVDLFHEGWAPRILLSPGQLEPAEALLRQRHIPFPHAADLVRDAMTRAEIPASAITILPGWVDNTAQEAAAARRAAVEAGWRQLIVVTSKYHSRRAAYAFAREFRGTSVRILMRYSRYDTAVPERWWSTRQDVRYVTSELQKLAAYRLGLGE